MVRNATETERAYSKIELFNGKVTIWKRCIRFWLVLVVGVEVVKVVVSSPTPPPLTSCTQAEHVFLHCTFHQLLHLAREQSGRMSMHSVPRNNIKEQTWHFTITVQMFLKHNIRQNTLSHTKYKRASRKKTLTLPEADVMLLTTMFVIFTYSCLLAVFWENVLFKCWLLLTSTFPLYQCIDW